MVLIFKIISKYCYHSLKSVHLSSFVANWRLKVKFFILPAAWSSVARGMSASSQNSDSLHLSHLALLSLVCETVFHVVNQTFLFTFSTCYLKINIINIWNSKGLYVVGDTKVLMCRWLRFCDLDLPLAIY